MPRISIGDCSLYYEENGSGEPLLLVPGLGGVGAGFFKQIPELSRRYRVIVHDHRGCGQSDRPVMRYSVEQMAQDVLRLMDALNIERAHLLGHSTGGAIGQIIAIEQPRRLKSLILSSTWTHGDAFFTRIFEARHALLKHTGPVGYLRATSAVLYPGWWVAQNETLVAEQERQQAAGFPPVEVALSRIEAIMRFDRREQIPRIRVPTLVSVAADDVVTPLYFSQALAKAIPGAKLKVFESGGHLLYHVIDREYTRAVLDFLSSDAL
jgi:aminoacrylate hydrolase